MEHTAEQDRPAFRRRNLVTPLLTTKLTIPFARTGYIVRPRLQRMLDEGLQRKLTLISAPAGFGKTTLAATWARGLSFPTAWISLDQRDNDPVIFFSYLFNAFDEVPWAGQAIQDDHLVIESVVYSVTLTEWINAMAQMASQTVLLLDDLHLIENPSIHQAVAFLLENLPPNQHLILITRSDPPIPLARLRGLGQMVEIREADLRFSMEEVIDFFQHTMGIALEQPELSALHDRTEGWAVGLQLAGLALQERQDRKGFINSFTGEHHFIIDYLTEEVFNYQPEAVKTFLMQTCLLERMCASLCDAVTGENNGEAMLHLLDQSNLFTISLDDERHWYRYHRLFADILTKHLVQAAPELIQAIHQRASAWFEQQDSMAEAIEHALAAQDYEHAARLIEKHIEPVVRRSEISTLTRWLSRLPDEYVSSRENLCFYHTWALIASGRAVQMVERRLQDLNRFQVQGEQNPQWAGRISALNAYRALLQGDLGQAGLLSQQALDRLGDQDGVIRSIMTWIANLAAMKDSDLQGNQQTLGNIARMGISLGNPFIAVTAISYQAKLQMRQGHLHQAKQTLEQALATAIDSRGKQLPIASEALVLLGDLEREWNNLGTAENLLRRSIELARQWNELAAFEAYFPLARIKIAQGDLLTASQLIETAGQIASLSESIDFDDAIAELQKALFNVKYGDIDQVSQWADTCGLIPGSSGSFGLEGPPHDIHAHLRKYELLVLARLYLRQCRAADAQALLAALLAHVRKLNRADLILQCQILRALAFRLTKDLDQALEALGEALMLGKPGRYVRIFLDEGESLVELLQLAAGRKLSQDYVTELLAAYYPPKPETQPDEIPPQQPLNEPISARELEVLRLLAIGKSNREIAEALVIAVSTVRSHCKSIYGKLGVHRRWDAVERSRQLGLIQETPESPLRSPIKRMTPPPL